MRALALFLTIALFVATAITLAALNCTILGPYFTLIASVMGESVIGHGIGGINFPDIMARLAKMQDSWNKQ